MDEVRLSKKAAHRKAARKLERRGIKTSDDEHDKALSRILRRIRRREAEIH